MREKVLREPRRRLKSDVEVTLRRRTRTGPGVPIKVQALNLHANGAAVELRGPSELSCGETVIIEFKIEGGMGVPGIEAAIRGVSHPDRDREHLHIQFVSRLDRKNLDRLSQQEEAEEGPYSGLSLLEEREITLKQLGDLIHPFGKMGKRFHDPPMGWGGYFQSPVSKAAQTLDGRIEFDPTGALKEGTDGSKEALSGWLGLSPSATSGPRDRAEAAETIPTQSEDHTDGLSKALDDWLDLGSPNKHLFERIQERLSEEALTNADLYNHPVCRLVRRSQLRYDPNYAAVYQLTPAAIRFLSATSDQAKEGTDKELGTDDRSAKKDHGVRAGINCNQRIYRGLSELFHSLIAMFDSDMGAPMDDEEEGGGPASKPITDLKELAEKFDRKTRSRPIYVTKEFIRIEAKDERLRDEAAPGGEEAEDEAKRKKQGNKQAQQVRTHLTPNELNRYSPLRFWSPPPAFARCVFHMLFWQSVITGKDLFGRDVPEQRNASARPSDGQVDEVEQTLRERLDDYFVIVNQFNAAKYRIAEYARLVEALANVALRVESLAARHEFGPNAPLSLFPSEAWVDPRSPNRPIFYPEHAPPQHGNESKQAKGQPGKGAQGRYDQRIVIDPLKVKLSLPFEETRQEGVQILWELAARYQQQNGPETNVGHILKMLRDRILELILWSRYQMEIRSVGVVPVQHVYRIELDKDGRELIRRLIDQFSQAGGDEKEQQQRKRYIAGVASDSAKQFEKIEQDLLRVLKPQEVERRNSDQRADPDAPEPFPGLARWIKLRKIYDRGPRRAMERSEADIKWFERSDQEPERVRSPEVETRNDTGSSSSSDSTSDRHAAEIVLEPDEQDLYGKIEPLQSVRQMVWYYHRMRQSMRHLVGDKRFADEAFLARVPRSHIDELRRYINADLENYALEFFLQRRDWALKCRDDWLKGPEQWKDHLVTARENPARHPCQMQRGFARIVDADSNNQSPEQRYPYEQFLGESLSMVVAIHAHLASITKSLMDLHYSAAELPFASFSEAGANEIRHLTTELRRIMRGLLVATHLQNQANWQADLVSYLLTCRADCQRLFETIPRYYQTHRFRLVLYPISPPADHVDPYTRGEAHAYPITCLPWSAGLYQDFLIGYQAIAYHVMAISHWSIRMYALWYFVPRRLLRAISPMFLT